jgi:hypothetical protein
MRTSRKSGMVTVLAAARMRYDPRPGRAALSIRILPTEAAKSSVSNAPPIAKAAPCVRDLRHGRGPATFVHFVTGPLPSVVSRVGHETVASGVRAVPCDILGNNRKVRWRGGWQPSDNEIVRGRVGCRSTALPGLELPTVIRSWCPRGIGRTGSNKPIRALWWWSSEAGCWSHSITWRRHCL